MTKAQREELDKRYADYQNGVGKTYAWDETVAIAEQAFAERRAFIDTVGTPKKKFRK